jgi:hypothetical protein
LFDRLQAGRISWGQAIAGETEELFGPDAERSIYTTGIPPLRDRTSGVITRWTLLDEVGGGDARDVDFPVKAGLTTRSGELVWPKDKTRVVDHLLPYVLLSGENPPEVAWHQGFTTIESPRSGEMTWYFSATGPATFWVNGTKHIDLSDLPYGLVGATWRALTIPVRAGGNHVLLQVASRGAPAAFALSADVHAINYSPVAVDDQGYIRKWKIIGPWKNWRNLEGKYRGNAHAFPPESRLDFHMLSSGVRNMPLIWHEATYDSPIIPHPWVDGVSYAYTVIEVSEDTTCQASLGSDDGYVIWINGKLVGRNPASRGFKIDVEQLPVVLKKGRNQVLFKIDDTGGAGAFSLRFLRDDGRPVDLTVVE